jgi:hypothetical protein
MMKVTWTRRYKPNELQPVKHVENLIDRDRIKRDERADKKYKTANKLVRNEETRTEARKVVKAAESDALGPARNTRSQARTTRSQAKKYKVTGLSILGKGIPGWNQVCLTQAHCCQQNDALWKGQPYCDSYDGSQDQGSRHKSPENTVAEAKHHAFGFFSKISEGDVDSLWRYVRRHYRENFRSIFLAVRRIPLVPGGWSKITKIHLLLNTFHKKNAPKTSRQAGVQSLPQKDGFEMLVPPHLLHTSAAEWSQWVRDERKAQGKVGEESRGGEKSLHGCKQSLDWAGYLSINMSFLSPWRQEKDWHWQL